jgi:undecaprenyl pyrophosphate phosphatase UppP
MEPTTSFKQKQFNNTKKLAFWTIIWVLATALATFGPEFIWENSLFTYAGVGLFLITGAAMIWANRKYLMDQDELQRRMHLEAMSITLGVAVVLGLGLSILDQQDLLFGFDLDFAFITIIISVSYMLSLLINLRRFK